MEPGNLITPGEGTARRIAAWEEACGEADAALARARFQSLLSNFRRLVDPGQTSEEAGRLMGKRGDQFCEWTECETWELWQLLELAAGSATTRRDPEAEAEREE